MDMYKRTGPPGWEGTEVDLDDFAEYPESWLEMSFSDLKDKIWSEMGKSLFYMQFFYPEMRWQSQAQRVDKLCKEYAKGINIRRSDSAEARLWCYKILFRFLDEVENQC